MNSCVGQRSRWSDRRGSGCWSPVTEKRGLEIGFQVFEKVIGSEDGRWSKVRSECLHGPKFLNFPAVLPGKDVIENQRRNTREARCRVRLDHQATREGTARENISGGKRGRFTVTDDWHYCLSLGALRGSQSNYSLTVIMSHRCVQFWEEWCHPSEWRCQSMLRDANYT